VCSCLPSLRGVLPWRITQFAPCPCCYMLSQSLRLGECNKHSIRAGRGHCITHMQYFLAGFIDQALKPSTSTLWNILLPGRQAYIACLREIGRGFFAGVCTPSNAPANFRDPPPPLDTRIDSGDTLLLYSASPGSCWSSILGFEKISPLRRWATNAFRVICDQTLGIRLGIILRTSKA
jgi:hypothetical protein